MTAGDHNRHVSIEDLSAFADGEALTPEQRATIEHHLDGCPACREELDSLRAVSALLSDLPAPEAPRSFRLAPADVGMGVPQELEPVQIEPWIVRNQSRFRWAGLAAAVLLVMVISADLFSATDGDDAVTDFTMMQEAAEEAAPPDEDLDADAPSIMSGEEADEPAIEEAEQDAVMESEPADEEEFPVAEEAPQPEDGVEESAAPEIAPDDVAGTEDSDHPVSGRAADDDMASLQAANDTDNGLTLLQWTGIVLAVLTVLLLGSGFLLPRIWPTFPRSPR
jgi:hypothetical protein